MICRCWQFLIWLGQTDSSGDKGNYKGNKMNLAKTIGKIVGSPTSCIGCEKPCEEGLCKECESTLVALEKALNNAGVKLELVDSQCEQR